ncbi:MAG TPA: ATP-binding protein [Ktedonobacteraceae bacterium]|nr:ATP-binding protein [Ktedonobacteraceae bacterium]
MDDLEQSTAALLEELDVLRARVAMLEQGEGLQESQRIAALSRDVGVALVQDMPLQQSLQQCAQAFVHHLDAAFARIWTLNIDTQVLELQASAGLYTHLDGAHSRVPVGSLKIGLIAAERLPHLTNTVIGDARVSEQEWAKREGMVAFAGYPLLIEEKVVGVMALFARKPLTPTVLDAMASVANVIALGIDHKRVEDEREHLLLEEQQARDQAEAALQVRNIFLSAISHDLKTPLTAIKGTVQIWQRRAMRAQALDISQLLKGLDLIESATRNMTVMIDDVLDLAQLQSGQQLELSISQLDVVALVQQVAAALQATTTRHRIRVEAAVPHVLIPGDVVRLDRVMANLLSNAIKYSPQGGTITVTVSQEECEDKSGGCAVVEVSDQGLGIPAADLPHIFDQFRRATNVTGRILGMGIGLANCLQIVRQHGGTIGVTSLEGSGTTFLVRLPCNG